MKKIFTFLLILCLSFSLVACGGKTEIKDSSTTKEKIKNSKEEPKEESKQADKEEMSESVSITFAAPPAPPTLPLLHMIETKALGENVELNLDVWSDPETLMGMVQDKKHDIFALPLTVGAKLYNKGMPMRLLNVSTWGVDYFLTTDPNFKTWSDLEGKTLYVPLQSSPLDALSQYFLNEASLTPGENVTIVYGSILEIATLIATGEAEYAVLLEPQVSRVMMQNDKIRIAFSLEDEWKRATGVDTSKPTAGIGTTQAFIESHPELIEKFQEAYAESIKWIHENPKEAGKLAEKYLNLKAPLIVKALPNMGLRFETAQEAKESVQKFYGLLLDFNSNMIGGKQPSDSFYYEK